MKKLDILRLESLHEKLFAEQKKLDSASRRASLAKIERKIISEYKRLGVAPTGKIKLDNSMELQYYGYVRQTQNKGKQNV